MHEDIDKKVEKNKSDYQKINHQLLTLVESHKVESHKVEGYQKEVKDLTSKIQNLESLVTIAYCLLPSVHTKKDLHFQKVFTIVL